MGDGRVVVARLPQARLDLDSLGQGDGRGWIVWHHLGQTVDHAQGLLQHPAHIAQHGPGLQGAEGDDLGHAVAAIFFLNVGDDLFAAFLAEVDIEIGHGHAFGVQEPLED